MNYFRGGFTDKDDVAETFGVQLGDDVNILVAVLNSADYEEDAYVLFEQDEKLYEAYGSHCSCYGFEGQWEPEETHVAMLENELENNYHLREIQEELGTLIPELKSRGYK